MTLPPGTASSNALIQQVANDVARRRQEEGYRVAVQSMLQRVEAFAALYEGGDKLSAAGTVGASASASGSSAAAAESVTSAIPPGFLLPALVTLGEKTSDGHTIELVAPPWFRIAELAMTNPSALDRLDWRQLEELVAGAYANDGYEVVLTPRSNDGGRDVIATKPGLGSVRIFDQVKRYSPGNVVTAETVRAMLGVLTFYGNVSKGVITTTAQFAPGVLTDEHIQRFVPYRLELRGRQDLLAWFAQAAANRSR